MRYTESDFTIDHIFDFIRLVFSSVFLAPFRFCNEYSKKLLFIDKEHIRHHVLLALGLNLVLGVFEIIRILRTRAFIVLASNVPALLISFIVIVGLYSLVMSYDQPKVSYGKKPRPIKSSRKKEVKFDAEDLISDNEEAIQEIAKEEEMVNVSDSTAGLNLAGLKMNSPEKEKVELSLDLSQYNTELDYSLMPETPQDLIDEMEKAYEEDTWGIKALWDSLDDDVDAVEDMSIKLENMVAGLDMEQLRNLG